MTREWLEATAVIGIIRVDQAFSLDGVVSALSEGGCQCIEITMTTPNALESIGQLSTRHEGCVIGAGTVLQEETARAAVEAGARFLVSPTVSTEVIRVAHQHDVVSIIGAMTPTEALAAWEAGADMVKVFPASVVGPRFVREMQGPLPQIPLVATGGITAETAGEFIRAGAAAVCAGSWLVDKEAIAAQRLEVLTERARRLIAAARAARQEMQR